MRKKILIADDDKDLVEVLATRLQGAGFDTICVYEGIRAIESAHKEKPDLILLDWKMPAGKGSDVLKDLKGKSDTSHIPVIVITGLTDPAMESLAFKLGAKGFIQKPFNDKVLLQKIREAFELEALEDSLI